MPTPRPRPDDLLPRLFAGLDALVLRRDPEGVFSAISALPAWVHGFPELVRQFDEPGLNALASDQLTAQMPFLSIVLLDAEEAWSGAGAGPLHSDPWTQQDASGAELELDARALRAGEDCVLIISRTGAAAAWRREAQQQANVAALRHEADVKLQRALRELAEAKAKAADAEKAANEAKSAFLANMSHELRTPLNAIILYSDLIKDEAEDRRLEQVISDVAKIKSASAHLLGLINTVLDLAKVEAGKMEVHLEDFDIAQLAREVGDTILPLAQKNGNTLAIQAPADLGAMRSDVTKVRQILFNLLSNACKFTSRGTVSLSIARPAGQHEGLVEFRVGDTGIGMSPEQLARMFKPFQQADASTSRKYGGTGLGLSISKQFCELLGGSIRVESEQGKGTTFIALLPGRSNPADGPY